MILFGASGHARVIIDILQNMGVKVNCIFDDSPTLTGIYGIPVKKSSEIFNADDYDAIVSIGNNEVRKEIVEKFPFNYVTAIHPTAVISEYTMIGEGTVVMASVVINPSATIGKHCIINTKAGIGHDCTIGNYVHISGNAFLAGNVEVGEGTHIGIGANVIQGVKIGKWAIVGAGAVVIRDVPDYATVVGNPAKVIKIRE